MLGKVPDHIRETKSQILRKSPRPVVVCHVQEISNYACILFSFFLDFLDIIA